MISEYNRTLKECTRYFQDNKLNSESGIVISRITDWAKIDEFYGKVQSIWNRQSELSESEKWAVDWCRGWKTSLETVLKKKPYQSASVQSNKSAKPVSLVPFVHSTQLNAFRPAANSQPTLPQTMNTVQSIVSSRPAAGLVPFAQQQSVSTLPQPMNTVQSIVSSRPGANAQQTFSHVPTSTFYNQTATSSSSSSSTRVTGSAEMPFAMTNDYQNNCFISTVLRVGFLNNPLLNERMIDEAIQRANAEIKSAPNQAQLEMRTEERNVLIELKKVMEDAQKGPIDGFRLNRLRMVLGLPMKTHEDANELFGRLADPVFSRSDCKKTLTTTKTVLSLFDEKGMQIFPSDANEVGEVTAQESSWARLELTLPKAPVMKNKRLQVQSYKLEELLETFFLHDHSVESGYYFTKRCPYAEGKIRSKDGEQFMIANTRRQFNEPPPLLTITLKRTQWGANGAIKNSAEVRVPLTLTLDKRYCCKKAEYELYGVVNQNGSANGGHYVATYRDAAGSFFDHDDTSSQPIRIATEADLQIAAKSGYMLFYRLINPSGQHV